MEFFFINVCWTKCCSVVLANTWMGVFTVREECLFYLSWKSFSLPQHIMLSRPVPATCKHLILVCRKCSNIAAYRYTCTYNVPYSLSYVRERCDYGLWLSLKCFSLTSFHHKSKILYYQAVIIECVCHDDGGSKNCSGACAPISVHFTSNFWKQ
jgi:hypothetical protein